MKGWLGGEEGSEGLVGWGGGSKGLVGWEVKG